jgi:hypothetical protein
VQQALKFWHFDTDVYGLHIGLILGPLEKCTEEWLTLRMRKAWPKVLPDEGQVELGANDEWVYADHIVITASNNTNFRFVRIPQFFPRGKSAAHDHAVLAHETHHLVATALRYLGVENGEHEEAAAYLEEYIYERFLTFLYKWHGVM